MANEARHSQAKTLGAIVRNRHIICDLYEGLVELVKWYANPLELRGRILKAFAVFKLGGSVVVGKRAGAPPGPGHLGILALWDAQFRPHNAIQSDV